MSFPWNSPSPDQCGCSLPTKRKSQSIFKRIASATGSWISGLLGVSTGQLIVRNDDTLGYLQPNCSGLLQVDTDGEVSIGQVTSIEGAASGNPVGYGYIPFLELFDKEICNNDGGEPTEEQWMRIKALMPQWIGTGEIAVLTPKECGSEEVRFDYLQPCPLPANGCPPSGLGYLASHVQQVTENGCCKNVRRWYWVTGLSLPDGDLIKNEAGDVDLNEPEVWQLPVLRKRGGCWFFETMARDDLIQDVLGEGLLTYRVETTEIYNSLTGVSDVTTNVAVPGYAEAFAAAKSGTPIYGIFTGKSTLSVGAGASGVQKGFLNSIGVVDSVSESAIDSISNFGERAILLTAASVAIRKQTYLVSGVVISGRLQVSFEGFQYTPAPPA